MKKIAVSSILLMFLLPLLTAYAAVTVIVQNYFFVHENTPGTFSFKDKFGSTAWYGDGIQHDASILSIDVIAQGMQGGDQITAYRSDGQSYPVTPGTTTNVSIGPLQTLSLKLTKVGTNEVFARIDVMRTHDASDGGTDVVYTYSLNDLPSEYGDLGPGSSSTITVPGMHYYFEPRDAYKYDYTVPTGATRYELHFLDSSGNTMYKRDYETTPTGVHYLTCNGTYEMRYFNSSGAVIGKSPHMETTEIQAPTCSSFAGNGAGFQDFPVTKTVQSNGVILLDWDAVPGATSYNIYKDGQLIAVNSNTTDQQVAGDGAITVVAEDANGNIVGQSDLLPPQQNNPDPGDPGDPSGCNGCQMIEQMLDCPAWDEYMGEWENMLQRVIPPPPNWHEVAGIMRDTIVPAMGQEIVNRAPEVAEIIADELESREDPVYPPGTIPTYSTPQPQPTMTDLPSKIPFDLNSNVPNFDPDFSGSQPFTLPDPLDIELSDEDAGYNAPDPSPSNSIPNYQSQEPTAEVDPGYNGSEPPGNEVEAPGYQITNPDANDPGRNYQFPESNNSGPIPNYEPPPEDGGQIPSYEMNNDTMPDYSAPGGGG